MSFLRRITQMLTPPPRTSTMPATPPPSQPRLASDSQSGTSANLSHELKRLVAADSADEPRAAQAISELKKLGMQVGLYVTASKMRFQLDAMPRLDSEGKRNHKDRGYVLAADFIYQHVISEIHAIETEDRSIGPNILRSYCNELVACLLLGRNVRRGIEIPVMLIDSLLERALDSGQHRGTYLDMVLQAIESTRVQSEAKYDLDVRERAKRRQDEKKASTDTPSEILSPTAYLDEPVLSYVKALEQQLESLKREFAQYAGVPAVQPGASPSDAKVAQAQYAYLNGVAKIAEQSGFASFTAFVLSRIGVLMQTLQPGAERDFFLRAARAYESQGNLEQGLLLLKLSAKRYNLAHGLYGRAGDTGKAGEMEAKLKK